MDWLWHILAPTPYAAPLLGSRRRLAYAICLLLILIFCLGRQYPTLREGNGERLQKLYVQEDCDTVLIVAELRQTPRFADTLRWWTGRWCGQSIFWRPLSSLLLWAEWKLFGRDFRGYAVVSILLAMATAVAALWALEPLLSVPGAAAVVVMAFVGLYTPWGGAPALYAVVAMWKNQPDLLAALGILPALGLAVRGRPYWALVPLAVAVGAKEVAFFGFALIPAVLLWQRWQGAEVPSWRRIALVFVAVGLALGVVRFLALPDVYRLGSNASWWFRAFRYYAGYPGSYVSPDLWLSLLLTAVVMLGVWAGRRGVYVGLGTLAIGTAATVGLRSVLARTDVVTAATAFIVEGPRLACLLVWFGGAYLAWTYSRPLLPLGLAFLVLGSAVTFSAAQAQDHARWLGTFGQHILAWAAVSGAWTAAPRFWREARAQWAALTDGTSEPVDTARPAGGRPGD